MGGSSTQNNDPYGPAKPYIDQQLASNYNLFNSQQPQYYRAQYQSSFADPATQAQYDKLGGQATQIQNQQALSSKLQSFRGAQQKALGLTGLPGYQDPMAKYRQAQQTRLAGIQGQQQALGTPTSQRVYNADTVAGPNAVSQEASDATLARARAGSDIQRNMERGVADTLGGAYMNSNPYLDQTFGRMADQVGGRVQQQMMMAGREGSGANQDMLTRQLGDLSNQVYGQNYRDERQNQMNLYGQAPQLAQSGYDDINRIGQVGAGLQAYQQRLIDADRAAFDYEQNAPFVQAQNYQNMLNGGVGRYQSTTTNTTPGVLDIIGAIGGLM